MYRLKKVLLVDDDSVTNYLNIRLFTKSMVTKQLVVRQHGLEALQYLLECEEHELQHPDMIVLDVAMPEMDGLQFLEEYERLFPGDKSRLIVLTSSWHLRIQQACQKYNVRRLMVKPLTEEKLKDLVALEFFEDLT